MTELEKVLEAIKILTDNNIPEPVYPYEFAELESDPVHYYKLELINIAHEIKDAGWDRDHHCSSRDCSNWKTGPAPDSCKKCVWYHEEPRSSW